MADEAEDVLKELEDYHEKAKKKIEKIEQPKEVKKEKPKGAVIKEDKPREIKAEKKAKEEKKPKKMEEGKEITIKIRVNPRVIERIAYITVILILVYFAFFKDISIDISLPSFGRGNDSSGKDTTETDAASDTSNDTTTSSSSTSSSSSSSTASSSTTTSTGKIEAELDFSNDNIGTTGAHPSVKVTSITYKIRNKGDNLYSRADIHWYDEADTDVIKNKARASYKLKVNAGKVATKTITSFEGGTYLNSDNEKETFVLKLYDDKTGKELDSVSVIFTPS